MRKKKYTDKKRTPIEATHELKYVEMTRKSQGGVTHTYYKKKIVKL